MRRRWVIAAVVALALVAGATGLAASSKEGPGDARSLSEYFFGPRMARAEVVMVIGRTVRDFRIDQGRVTLVSGTTLELLEVDGSRQQVPVAPDARVLVNGKRATLTAILPGMLVLTVRDADGPAEVVKAVSKGRLRP